MATADNTRQANRIKLVEEHVQVESAGDLQGTMQTLGQSAAFVINGVEIADLDGIRSFYSELMTGFPDLNIDVKHQHVSDEAVIVECVLSGTHKNTWNGISTTGKRIELPACVVFTFDEKEKIAGERVYFDAALMLTQLGVLPAPETA